MSIEVYSIGLLLALTTVIFTQAIPTPLAKASSCSISSSGFLSFTSHNSCSISTAGTRGGAVVALPLSGKSTCASSSATRTSTSTFSSFSNSNNGVSCASHSP